MLLLLLRRVLLLLMLLLLLLVLLLQLLLLLVLLYALSVDRLHFKEQVQSLLLLQFKWYYNKVDQRA